MLSQFDLHMHSCFSDGYLTPTELVKKVFEAKIQTFALTDHDTTDGVFEAQQQAKLFGIECIPAAEISAKWKEIEVHIVALKIDLDSVFLQEQLSQQKQRRRARAQLMSNELEKIGLKNAFDRIKERIGHEHIGRAHFAKLMIEEGYGKDFSAIFKHYLTKGKPGYVPNQWPALSCVLDWIKQAKGIAILAHPARYKLTANQLRHLLIDFKNEGGVAMEVVTANHNQQQIEQMAKLSEEFELYASIGSDFHGEGIHAAKLGYLSPLPSKCRPVWHYWSESNEPTISNTSR